MQDALSTRLQQPQCSQPRFRTQRLLLRYCAVPKASFRTRSTPSGISATAARQHDLMILHALESIQGFGPPDEFRDQWETICQLPKRQAGMGLLSAAGLAKLSFLSSISEAAGLMRKAEIQPRFQRILPTLEAWLAPPPRPNAELPTAAAQLRQQRLTPVLPILQAVSADLLEFVNAIKQHRQRPSHENFAESLLDNPKALPKIPSDLAAVDPKLQKRLSLLHHEMISPALNERLSPSARAMRLSLKCKGASAPLEAIPSCQELTLCSEVFKSFLWSYQLIPIFQFESKDHLDHPMHQPCNCRSSSRELPPPPTVPGHFYCCTLAGGMTDRHDCVANELAACLRSASVTVTNRIQHARGSGPVKPRPDLDGVDWPGLGDQSFFEVTVTSHLRPSVLQRSQEYPLSAANDAERGKLNKYSQLATDENKHLYLLAFEASGAFGHGVSFLLSSLAARADPLAFEATSADRTWASHTWKQYWKQRIACAFWRGTAIMFQKNAAAVRGRHIRNQLTEDEEVDEDTQGPVRAAGPKMGCSFYQAPPPQFRQAHPAFHHGAAPQHQPPTPPQQAGASHSAAPTSGHESVAQPPRREDGAGTAASSD